MAKRKNVKVKVAVAAVAVASMAIPAPAKVVLAHSYTYGTKTPRHKAGHNKAQWHAIVAALGAGNATLAGVLVQTVAPQPATQPNALAPTLTSACFVAYAVRRMWLAIAQ